MTRLLLVTLLVVFRVGDGDGDNKCDDVVVGDGDDGGVDDDGADYYSSVLQHRCQQRSGTLSSCVGAAT
eukprot:8418207-Pyramimonas_sp.AAC.1